MTVSACLCSFSAIGQDPRASASCRSSSSSPASIDATEKVSAGVRAECVRDACHAEAASPTLDTTEPSRTADRMNCSTVCQAASPLPVSVCDTIRTVSRAARDVPRSTSTMSETNGKADIQLLIPSRMDYLYTLCGFFENLGVVCEFDEDAS